MIEKESLTHRIEDDMERRNRNWDIINVHLRNYTEQRQQDQLKVATIEKELNDYKRTIAGININHEAKQSASGYGTISLPPNAANGQVSVSVKGVTRTNLSHIINGDLSSAVGSKTSTVIENGYFKTTSNSSGTANFGDIIGVNEGQILTLSLVGYATEGSTSNTSWVMSFWDKDNTLVQYNNVSFYGRYTPTLIKLTKTVPENATVLKIYPLVEKDKALYVKDILVEEGEEVKSYISSGTKSTIAAMKIKSVGKNLWGIKHNSDKMYNRISGDVLDGSRQISNYKNHIVGKVKINNQTLKWIRDEGTIYIPGSKLPYVLFTQNGYVKKYINLALANGEIMLDGEYDVILGSYWNRPLAKGDYCNLKYLGIDNISEPYVESIAYVVAKKDNKIVNLMSHEGVHDEIDLDKRELIKRIGVDEEGLTYQLAEPEIIPIQVSGNIVSNPSGTIYIEQATFSTSIYNDNMKVMYNDLPIKSINKIIKIDYETGVEHELDTLKAAISEDKLSFIHPDLTNGDIVFFDYEYDMESTHGETTVEFYDSRYTIKDSITGKFYQWNVTVADGVPSIDLKEV